MSGRVIVSLFVLVLVGQRSASSQQAHLPFQEFVKQQALLTTNPLRPPTSGLGDDSHSENT
jgi:hypothetical protein